MKNPVEISHVHLDTKLVVCDDFTQLLIIENANEFFKMVYDLDCQFNGEEGSFVFSVLNEITSPEKLGVMVCDVFHFDLNDKKIINLLYKKLEKESLGDKCQLFNRLSVETVRFFEELSFSVPFQLSYDEPSPSDYMKTVSLKFEKAYDTLEEKIICYVNALIELKKCEFFVFVNLKSVLDDDKLKAVYNHCRNEKVGLLLIECRKIRTLLSCEKAIIITEDLCEILENYDKV